MAYSAPYTQGTISLDPDDASIVVGNGTLWSTVALPNDKIESMGLAPSIKEVIDDSHLKLYYDWPGTAPDGASYVLNFTSEKRGTTADVAAVQRDTLNRLRIFQSAVAVFSVKKFAVSSPPVDAIVGDRYVVGAAGTSDFAGHNNEIAEKTETGYLFTIPQHGYHVIDEEQNFVRAWTGASWGAGIGFGASLTYAGPWDAETAFKIGNVVTYGDRVWISKANNTNSEPTEGSDDWDLFINVGEDGGAFALRYVFKSDVDDSDPGTGSLKFNNAPGVATVLRVSKSDTYGNDWSELIASINTSTTSLNKGKIRVAAKGDRTKQVIANVITATSVGDYLNLTISSVFTSSADLADGDEVVFLFQERGDAGAAATISVGSVTTLNPDQPATVGNGGSSAAAIFNFGIPKGNKGDAATIEVGIVTTLAPDEDATVLNSGTSSDAVFNFGIPQGVKGDTGAQGQGIQPNATGAIAGRAVFDGEPEGFIYLSTDESPNMIYVMGPGGSADWSSGSPVGGLQPDLNLSDLMDSDEALDNLGSTAMGKALFKAADAAAARSALEISNELGDKDRRSIILNAILNAKTLGVAQPFIDAWCDGFGGNDAINGGASSGYLIDTANKRVINVTAANAATIIAFNAAGSTNVGNMTSGAGLAAAFDNTTSQAAASSARAIYPPSGVQWIGKDYGSGNTHRIGRFRVFGPNNGPIGFAAGTQIRLYGSNVSTGPTTPQDGTLIYSGTSSNTTAEIFDATVDSATAYRWVWVTVSSSSNAAPADAVIAEVQFYDYVAPTAENIVLIGTGYDSLDAVPNALRVSAIFENIDAGMLNTDFKISVSRDNGTTWSAAALVAYHTLGTKTFVESGAIDVSGQPSGSKPCYKYETLNNKRNYLHGVHLQAA